MAIAAFSFFWPWDDCLGSQSQLANRHLELPCLTQNSSLSICVEVTITEPLGADRECGSYSNPDPQQA